MQLQLMRDSVGLSIIVQSQLSAVSIPLSHDLSLRIEAMLAEERMLARDLPETPPGKFGALLR
jgi:hypothetical protein